MLRIKFIFLLLISGNLLADTYVDILYHPDFDNYFKGYGIGIYSLSKEKSGLYLTLSGDLKEEPLYEISSTTIDPNSLKNSWSLINFGITGPILSRDMISLPVFEKINYYVGIGLYEEAKYYKSNNSFALSDWYKDPEEKTDTNFNAGIIWSTNSYGLNLGFNSAIKTLTFGLGIYF